MYLFSGILSQKTVEGACAVLAFLRHLGTIVFLSLNTDLVTHFVAKPI